eukprot:s3615_g5.t1
MLWVFFHVAKANPELLWSRGLARSCDVFPDGFQINKQGHEVGIFDWDSVISIEGFQQAPSSARITLVTGQEERGSRSDGKTGRGWLKLLGILATHLFLCFCASALGALLSLNSLALCK